MALDFTAARATSLLEVAPRYIEIRKRGGEYVGLCPFHADSDPSLTIYPGRDGLWRYRCFACGAHGDVVDWIREIEGCDAKEAVARLTGGNLPPPSTRPPPIERPTDETSAWVPFLPVPEDAPPYDPARTFNPRRGRIVRYKPQRTDTYRDAGGRVLCHVVRLVFEDGKKLCPTITFCEGPGGKREWCVKRMAPPYPLQGLDDLAARPEAHVLVVSGEKCRACAAEHLSASGFVVVTWLGGDESVDKADVEPLRGRKITFWPDADDSCRKAMARLAERLS